MGSLLEQGGGRAGDREGGEVWKAETKLKGMKGRSRSREHPAEDQGGHATTGKALCRPSKATTLVPSCPPVPGEGGHGGG